MTVDTFERAGNARRLLSQAFAVPLLPTASLRGDNRRGHTVAAQRKRGIGRALHQCGNAKCLTTGGHASPSRRHTKRNILNPAFSRENKVVHRDWEGAH